MVKLRAFSLPFHLIGVVEIEGGDFFYQAYILLAISVTSCLFA